MEEPNYLAADFDPTTLKIPDLRRILQAHEVSYPSTSKKADLVDLFERNIKPNAETILAQQRKVKASGHGIQSMPGSSDYAPPPSKKTPSRTRKAPRAIEDSEPEEIEIEVESKSAKKLTSRALKKTASTASSSISELDQDGFVIPPPRDGSSRPPPPSPSRRGRPSKKKQTALSEMVGDPSASESDVGAPAYRSATPKKRQDASKTPVKKGRKSEVKKETTESEGYGIYAQKVADDNEFSISSRDKSPFSDYNPFQSGVDTTPDAKEKKSRRKSAAGSKSREHTPTGPSAIKQEPLLKKFMLPPPSPEELSRTHRASSETASVSTAGGSGNRSKSGRRKSRRHPTVEMEVFSWSSIALVVLVGLLAYGFYSRRAILASGFCDDDGSLTTNHTTFQKSAGDDQSADAITILSKCTPCPAHGLCKEGELFGCDDGFIVALPFYSLGGLIPHTEGCRPDTKKQRHIVEVSQAILYELAVHAGQVICGTKEIPEHAAGWAARGGMRVDQLWELVEEKRNLELEAEEFREYWNAAILDLRRRHEQVEVFELQSAYDKTTDVVLISKQPLIWFTCRVRKDALRLLYDLRFHILGVFLLSFSSWAAYAYLQIRRREKLRVATLVHTVLTHLSDQEQLHYVDPVQTPNLYIAITHLRDLLLHNEPHRDRLWHQVEREISRNSNIRERVGEVRGEQHRVWEWIGGVASPNMTPVAQTTADIYGSPVPYPAAKIAAAGSGLYPSL